MRHPAFEGLCLHNTRNYSLKYRRTILYSKTHQKEGAKHFMTSQKLDCLAQHPKKLLNQNYTSK